MSSASSIPTGGSLRVQVTEDLLVDGGNWELTEDQKGQPVARIVPPSIPMFRQVVDYLETKRVPAGGTAKREEEARAAVAVCLRCGSYFAVLSDPSRPDAPAIDDPEVSQIDDQEMARMNIEISAPLEWWLELRGEDEKRYENLVDRALAYLPMGPKTFRPLDNDDLAICTFPPYAASLRNGWPADRVERDLGIAAAHGIRVIANTITNFAWRNGPVEGVHSGRFEGYGLDQQRVLPESEKAIVRRAQCGFATGLKTVDSLKYHDAWPPPADRVLPFLHGRVCPTGWSFTELSRAVELPLRRRPPVFGARP